MGRPAGTRTGDAHAPVVAALPATTGDGGRAPARPPRRPHGYGRAVRRHHRAPVRIPTFPRAHGDSPRSRRRTITRRRAGPDGVVMSGRGGPVAFPPLHPRDGTAAL